MAFAFKATRSYVPAAVGGDADPEVEVAERETNSITSRLVLLYVERVGGRVAVARTLERARLPYDEAQLLSESLWFSWEQKVALFEAAAAALDDPEVTLRIGERALDLNVGQGLKIGLRALGSPRLVYQNIARANARFGSSHAMDVIELGGGHARVRLADRGSGGRYHPLDCNYVRGLIASAPKLFGLPQARVTHRECGCRGADACVYDVRWNAVPNHVREAVFAAAGGGGAVAAAVMLAPALLPAAAGVAVGALALVGGRAIRHGAARRRELENELRDHAAAAHSLTRSLQDLVSERRLEDVLAKVTRSAQLTVGSKEFVLLISEGAEMTCQGSTGLPDAVTRVLERWAERSAVGLAEPLVIDDVASEPGLKALTALPPASFGSVCAAPLMFRGEHLGTLVALAPLTHSLLPRDIELIQSFATQAAIAIANARLYGTLEELARRDPLTGLFNHREFQEAIAQEVERCRRYGARVAVALLDLDGFKEVNDSDGHAEGDRVLRAVAAVLTGSCRASDLAFRVGGDEFALILPESGSKAAAAAAARARDRIAQIGATLDVSWGVASWPEDATSKERMLALADARLYAMKHARREGRPAAA